MRMTAIVAGLVMLSGCATGSLQSFCETEAPKIRSGAIASIATADALLAVAMSTPGLERTIPLLQAARQSALISLGQINAACPLIPEAATAGLFEEAAAAAEAAD